MNRILVIFIDSLLFSTMLIYCSGLLLNKKIKCLDKKYITYFFINTIYLVISYLFISNFIKIFLTLFILTIVNVKIYKVTIVKAIISAFSILVLTLVSEIIYVIFITIIFKINLDNIRNAVFGGLFSNCIVILFVYIIIRTKLINKFLSRNIILKTSNNNKKTIVFSFLTLFIITMLVYYLYFELKFIYGLLLCLIIIIVYILTTFFLFKEQAEYAKLQFEYEITLNSLSEYEKLYSYQRMMNHEFKNDLMIIRGMTNKNNKKLLSYIDEIVVVKKSQNVSWIESLKRIPEGGLLGLLYYKLLLIEEEKININFSIGRNFKSKSYKQVSDELKCKICKILGIYLDNAIQAVKPLIDKNISIRINQDNNYIIFEIVNNYSGEIDQYKIYEKGYSSNGIGRGYGLAIVKDILDSEFEILNKTSIIGNQFFQEIKIKI